MDLLFRLEQTTGSHLGTYTARLVDYYGTVGSYHGENHPGPGCDGLPSPHDGFIFGFTSISEARRWWYVDTDLEIWTGCGLRLAVWPAHLSARVDKGGNQCRFSRPSVAPLYLPCEAIHRVPLPIIEQMVRDHFNMENDL